MKDFDFATATPEELKLYAQNELDLKLSLNMNADTMRQRITTRCNELNIEPPEMVIQTKQDRQRGMSRKKTIVINIPKSEKPGGSEPAVVGVQGVLYTIPRGVNIAVSPSIVEVLRNGIQDIVTQDPDSGEIYHEDVPTYPFQIVRHLDPDHDDAAAAA